MVYRRETLMETGGFDGALKALSDLVVCLAISSRHGALFSPVAFCSTRVHDDSLRSRTLGDLSTFNAVLTHFERTAPSLAPQLFDAQLISRTKDRWRFSAAAIAPNNIAALLTQHSSSVGQIAARTIAPVARVTKSGSLALAYLILRPFDVIPTLWYRYILAMVLRLKNCTTPKP